MRLATSFPVKSLRAVLRLFIVACVCGVLLSLVSCGGAGEVDERPAIQTAGSNTMSEIAQNWAETYSTVNPNVVVDVSGGGSGIGITNLINGVVDIANSSREMSEEEMKKAEQKTGKKPVEWIVGYDGIAVYVHKDNPIKTMTMDQLCDIYVEDGSVATWSQLGVDHKKLCPSDEIIRVSRASSSGTYVYFRKEVLHSKDFETGAQELSGSKDVVDQVAQTPCAIGYSGMGFLNDKVKFVGLSSAEGETAYGPTVKNVHDKKYPLARPLRMYTIGQPEGEVKAYLDWVLSAEGQKVVQQVGYVPVKEL